MKRLRRIDTVLLVILGPLWILCFSLYVKSISQGRLVWVPVAVSAPSNELSYPAVKELWPGTTAVASGLAVGDQLMQVGSRDLRGAGPFCFVARVYEEAKAGIRLPVVFVRAGEQQETTLELFPVTSPWHTLPVTLGFALTGVLALFCEPGSLQARAFFLASLAYSFHWVFFFGGMLVQTYAWAFVFFFSATVMFPLSLRAALIFPEKIVLAGTHTPLWLWGFGIFGLFALSSVFGVPLSPTCGMSAVFVANVAFIIALLVILTRNFQRAAPLGRRQLKWVVYGFYIGTAPVLATDILATVEPSWWWVHEVARGSTVLIPLCIAIAILRVNFLDIDRLISSTAGFSLLGVLVIGAMLIVVPPLAQMASTATQIGSASWHMVFSLCVALCLMPGQRRVRPWIERVCFPEHHALEQGVTVLLEEISALSASRTLFVLVGDRLKSLLRPEHCVLYGKTPEGYIPMFVWGSVRPSTLPLQSPLVDALQTLKEGSNLSRWRSTVREQLDPEERTLFDNLRVAAALPVQRAETMAALLCLGRKMSGDVYTSTEYTLLKAIADKMAEILQRDSTKGLTLEGTIQVHL
jgi:hypothetical protein